MLVRLQPESNVAAGKSSCLGCAGSPGGMSGLGLFDAGLDVTSWGLMEWLIVGGGMLFAFGGGSALLGGRGATGARRKKLQLARAKYDLEKASL